MRNKCKGKRNDLSINARITSYERKMEITTKERKTKLTK